MSTLFRANSHMSTLLSFHTCAAMLYSSINGSYTHTHSGTTDTGKGSLQSITERKVPELIPVLGSQPAGDANHKPGGRLPLLSARPAATPATLKRAAANFAAL